ncbi:NEDD8-conjugating enzyme Ubc12 [Micractinium conductrix]|uniref:NEDD8-conjugating enzyme Ubc12 n=1 Tax=Micractinium conductrix TaxID=554055 RepID=A0A2P6V782_9CHLO|nr:NEDD8-conjugating enzyme Ubc12 [Micractinium conductrix]|eukprot:PSC69946.1 NEDD8-conjugating enzyme Ubc12 [Micractinium conductrix]
MLQHPLIDVRRPTSPASPRSPSRSPTTQAGSLRLQKDLSELDLPASNVELRFPHGADRLSRFEVALRPDEGCYAGGNFLFEFRVPDSYPSDPPQVRALTQVFHPAIDTEGHVDMSLLGADWRPDMSIKTVIYGLHRLFLLPDSDDSLNSAAGSLMHSDRPGFNRAVEESVAQGATIAGKFYPAAHGERNLPGSNEG